MTRYDVVIVGSGHGGASAAIALRQHKFDGSIAIISNDPDLPYERPPLSKDYLTGEKQFERIMLRPEHFWNDRKIELGLGEHVVAVDPANHQLELRSKERIGFGKMIWAAGGMPRRLTCDGADLKGVHSVRTRADVDRILAELASVSRVAVIGGGYIGLEAAAALRKHGCEVVILEALERVLARVAGAPISHFYEAEHRRNGVDVRTGVRVECIEGCDGVATGVRLADGEVVAAQMIIVGIGITPSVEALKAAGAVVSNGVHVDDHCRTNLADIFAIGDCALHENRFADGAPIRLESVQNANDQAQTAARWITGDPHPYDVVPWFWSNQYDLRLQTIGVSAGFDDLVVRGNPSDRSFSVVYLRRGKIAALDCVNDVRDYAQGKALVQAGASVPAAKLADRAIPLKDFMAAADRS